ncbi:MAG: HEAT repeat domain-containing protein [Kiritimatiellae bacterium]|nr:HEAT repeat domain-containing protein [Kiritimatiellia bacterium]
MDQKLKKIAALLQSPDNMRRSAAAIVLAELAPKDAAVVKALGAALETANQALTAYVLDALEAINSQAALPHVIPLLDAEDMATKMRAVSIVARAGAAVIPEVKARLEQAPRRQKFVLIDVLARIHARDAFRLLLDLLFDRDFELVRAVCDAIRRHMGEAGPKERGALHAQVVAFMNSARVKKQERVLTSCLLLLGHIARPEARAILLKHTAAKASPYVRRHALIGLKNLEYTGTTAKSVATQVLGYLEDSDPDIVRNALDVIRRLPATGISEPQWRKLLKSQNAGVRAFAARQLADVDTAANNRLLLDLLKHEDTDVQEIAARALSGHKNAVPLLLEGLDAEPDVQAVWRLVKILKPQSEAVDAKARRKFAAFTARELQTGKPKAEALLYFLRNVDPAGAEALLLETGTKCMRAKKWAQAVECLRRLIHAEGFDDKTRYALSVCNLKLSPKELTPNVRAEDHALRGFRTLLHSHAFKLLDTIQKDKTLDAADVYYVAFHFAEAIGDEKVFGEQLLEHLGKRWPKSKEGKAARSKLKLARPAETRSPARKTAPAKKAAGKKKTARKTGGK